MVVRLKKHYNYILDFGGLVKLVTYLDSDDNFVSALNPEQEDLFSDRRGDRLFYFRQAYSKDGIVTRDGMTVLEKVYYAHVSSYPRHRHFYNLSEMEIASRSFFDFIIELTKEHGV